MCADFAAKRVPCAGMNGATRFCGVALERQMNEPKFHWAMPIAVLLFGQIACSTQPPGWNAALGGGGEGGSVTAVEHQHGGE
jgi:hypothetical protein